MNFKYLKPAIALTALIAIIALCSFCFSAKENDAPNDNAGITFIEQDWNKALTDAKAQNKLVFLDIYATWCGPCKLLKKNTFSDPKVGEFFNSNFINVSVDGESGVGPTLAQQFNIEGYPSLIVTDTTGKPVLFTYGYMGADDLLAFAKEALKRKK